MKKLNYFFSSCIIIALLATTQVYGININCRNECYDSLPFLTNTITVQIPECPTCFVTITYLYRSGVCNGDTIHDIYVESWQYSKGDCPCPPFNDYGPERERWKKILTEALKHYEHYNVPWFDPSNPFITVNLKTPPCVSSYRNNTNRGKIVYSNPCEHDSCCIHKVKLWIRFDANDDWIGNEIISDEIILPFTSDCPFDPKDSNVQCSNICEPLQSTYPIFLESENKIRPKTQDVINILYKGKTLYKIPLSNFYKQYTVSVRNVFGNCVFSTSGNNLSNLLDLSSFAFGIYFIQIQTESGTQIFKILLY